MVSRLDGTYDDPNDIKKAREAAKKRGDKTFKVDGLRYDTTTGRRKPMSAAGLLEGLQRSIDSQKVRNKKDGMATGGMANMRKVPEGNKGLGKLPKSVRNKMGFMKTGGNVKKKGMAMGGMAKKKKKGMAAGGMMKKKKGYAMGGPMKKKGYAMGGPMKKKGYSKGGVAGGKRKGKVRGVRIASKGFRPTKMVKMKGS